MVNDCVFCNLEMEPEQGMILSNEYCMFLQLKQAQIKGSRLEGSGLIVPKKHRATVFELTLDEWNATYTCFTQI
ncbi:diadenosine tetraphosphate (Ap4A) HIT family hydrolase [Scopulibacillus daqui]|uniref:Diadenosine tetraphosphate (Ap4A) HIT family hydrolase n=1 Tax=Scopulibacillus daqui TaxID=1469162 RepID=A0ABS2Q0B9_9BACL|nr:diadenosine tetraphosphate (Ap4A) HIT family hydrolase [Scopulibacillus daqui]